MKTNLSLALSNSVSKEAQSIASDLLEVGLDTILDNDIIREIPLLSTAVSIYRIGKSIKERHYIQKLITFVSEMNKGIANEDIRK